MLVSYKIKKLLLGRRKSTPGFRLSSGVFFFSPPFFFMFFLFQFPIHMPKPLQNPYKLFKSLDISTQLDRDTCMPGSPVRCARTGWTRYNPGTSQTQFITLLSLQGSLASAQTGSWTRAAQKDCMMDRAELLNLVKTINSFLYFFPIEQILFFKDANKCYLQDRRQG